MVDCVESLFLSQLIEKAECTLAAHKDAGTLNRDALWLVEGLVAQMYEERRIVLESMMRRPFRPAR